MDIKEQKEALKCTCGGEYEYDGYNDIVIMDGLIVIKGDCRCDNCGKLARYEESHLINNVCNIEIKEEV